MRIKFFMLIILLFTASVSFGSTLDTSSEMNPAPQVKDTSMQRSFSYGLGQNYGGFGINFESQRANYSFNTAIGATRLSYYSETEWKVDLAIGLKHYIPSHKKRFSVRLLTYINWVDPLNDLNAVVAIHAGPGIRWRVFKRAALDIDYLFRKTIYSADSLAEAFDKKSLSLGLAFDFQ